MRHSYAITDSNGEGYLITHAGLTESWYRDIAKTKGYNSSKGFPATTDTTDTTDYMQDTLTQATLSPDAYPSHLEVSDYLNKADINDLIEAGNIIQPVSNSHAGIFWADCSSELYPSWVDVDFVPFHQVHGHTTIYSWEQKKELTHYPFFITKNALRDDEKMRTVWTQQGKRFYAIDLAFSKSWHHPYIPALHIVGE